MSRAASLVVASLVAINPHFATISTYLLTESLFMFLLLAGTLSLINAAQSKRRWAFVVTGVLWGMSSLVRPTVEFLPVLAMLGVLAIPRLRNFLPKAVLAFVCFAAILSPWVIRSQAADLRESSSVLLVNTLVHGSYPDFLYEGQPESFGFPYRFDPNLAKISGDVPSLLRHLASKFQNDPTLYARWYLVGKPIYFLSWAHVQGFDILIAPVNYTPYYQDIRFAIMRAISFNLHWPAMILGLAGILLLWLRPSALGLGHSATTAASIVALIVIYAIVFHMIAAPFPRYGLPFRPFLYALAALPFRAIWLKVHRWKLSDAK